MKNEKIEVPLELDAAVMQYAAEKNFAEKRWYWSLPARAAAVLLFGLALAVLHFAGEKPREGYVSVAEMEQYENLDWTDFDSKLEFVDEEIMAEAKYLAQL